MSSPVHYSKPVLDYSQQIKLLKSRGLIVQNEKKASHLLENISYYRLSGYWYPLYDKRLTDTFKSNATFETAFKLYCFDRELRILILKELEKIEVAVRAKMIYILSHSLNPFWFEDSVNFTNTRTHGRTLAKILDEYRRSDEPFIHSFRANYSNTFPPSWIALEITSFGGLSMLFSNLKPGTDKRSIANYFGLDETTFKSWLHSLVYMRNVCAHHSRLWNKTIRIIPNIPTSPRNQWLKGSHLTNDKVYFTLSMIIYLLNVINRNHSFKYRFNRLLVKYPMVDLGAMGFPNDWRNETLWQFNKWRYTFIHPITTIKLITRS